MMGPSSARSQACCNRRDALDHLKLIESVAESTSEMYDASESNITKF
jgi:hypothetical protein